MLCKLKIQNGHLSVFTEVKLSEEIFHVVRTYSNIPQTEGCLTCLHIDLFVHLFLPKIPDELTCFTEKMFLL